MAAFGGAVALPAVAARADTKNLLAAIESASALTQWDRPIGNGLRRHASPGRLDNGKPYVSVFRRSTAGDLLAYGCRIGTLPLSTAGSPCPSHQQHHISVKLLRRVPEMTDDYDGCARAVEMAAPWNAWKSNNRFPTLSTAPWESRKGSEIPTFPQPQAAVYSLIAKPKAKGCRTTMMMHMLDADRNSYRHASACPPADFSRRRSSPTRPAAQVH